MNKTGHFFKICLIVFAFGTALFACERRAADQGSQSSGAQSSKESEAMSSGARSSGATGFSGAYGSGVVNQAERVIDDSVITTKAKTALLADSTIKGTEISIETNRGIVSLSGIVDNEQQREHAASLVKSIDGVKSVDNKVTVKR